MKKDWFEYLKKLSGKEVFIITDGNDIVSGKVIYDDKWICDHVQIIQSKKTAVGDSQISLNESKIYRIFKESKIQHVKAVETEKVIVNLEDDANNINNRTFVATDQFGDRYIVN